MSAPALGRPESFSDSRSRNAFMDLSQESKPNTAAAAMCAQSNAMPPRCAFSVSESVSGSGSVATEESGNALPASDASAFVFENANLAGVFAEGSADAERRIGAASATRTLLSLLSSDEDDKSVFVRTASRTTSSLAPAAMTRTSSSTSQGLFMTTPSAQEAPSSGASREFAGSAISARTMITLRASSTRVEASEAESNTAWGSRSSCFAPPGGTAACASRACARIEYSASSSASDRAINTGHAEPSTSRSASFVTLYSVCTISALRAFKASTETRFFFFFFFFASPSSSKESPSSFGGGGRKPPFATARFASFAVSSMRFARHSSTGSTKRSISHRALSSETSVSMASTATPVSCRSRSASEDSDGWDKTAKMSSISGTVPSTPSGSALPGSGPFFVCGGRTECKGQEVARIASASSWWGADASSLLCTRSVTARSESRRSGEEEEGASSSVFAKPAASLEEDSSAGAFFAASVAASAASLRLRSSYRPSRHRAVHQVSMCASRANRSAASSASPGSS
mmetsp:Transcript_11337/g.48361  ORF Transcript_11337/g.48361 Transcript_11337/m.48361 type:complete len:519 (+) Transcript_11337:1063-2619(+)